MVKKQTNRYVYQDYCTLLEILAKVIRQEKATKGIQIGNKEVKLSLVADDRLYMEKSQKFHEKTKPINQFSKVIGYKINTLKLVPFLYTNSELEEASVKNAIHLQLNN